MVANNKIQNISELKASIVAYKKSFIIVGIFSLFINLLMLVSPLYMLQLYDRVLASRSEETLIMLTLIVVILFITMALLEIVRSKVLVRISNKLDTVMSKRIFSILFDLEKKNPGKASSMSINDMTQVRQFMTGNGFFAFFDTPWVPIYIAVLFLFHPWFGWFAIFAAIVLIVFAIINELSTKEKLSQANMLNREATLYVDASLKNAEVINAMGMKSNIVRFWEDKHNEFLLAQNDASNKAGVWLNISKTTRMLFQSMILGIGAYLAINMEVTPGMMIAGSIIMGRALAPLDSIIGNWKGFNAARTSYGKLESLLSEFPKEKDYMSLPAPKGSVTLENVVVTPPNATTPSLKNISLIIEEGSIVGVIGPSAAGKSSMARVILGLWPLQNGKSRLDQADIYQWEREALGKYIGYLPQDIELFNGTISQNIARFGEIDSVKIIEAAQKTNIHEMILRLPEGYDTKIGSGGIMLSAGQRQRLALARAIYNNPILVVLDEPNSNLDDVGERALLETIQSLKANKTTVIIITHKKAILSITDKICVLNQGQLENYGDSREILNGLMQPKSQTSKTTPSSFNKIIRPQVKKEGN